MIHNHENFKTHVYDKCMKTVFRKYLNLIEIQDAGHVVSVSKVEVIGV